MACQIRECKITATWTIIPMRKGQGEWGNVYRACSRHLHQVIEGICIDRGVATVLVKSLGTERDNGLEQRLALLEGWVKGLADSVRELGGVP